MSLSFETTPSQRSKWDYNEASIELLTANLAESFQPQALQGFGIEAHDIPHLSLTKVQDMMLETNTVFTVPARKTATAP